MHEMTDSENNPIQPVSGTVVPRFAGPSTFARLPEIRDVKSCDIAILGIPFDAGCHFGGQFLYVNNLVGSVIDSLSPR